MSPTPYPRPRYTAAFGAVALLMVAFAASADGSPRRDSDHDGLSNKFELRRSHTHPRRRDTDRDHLGDRYEIRVSRTSPKRRDSDGDGLSDSYELRTSNTDPLNPDTDGDGLTDGQEVMLGSNPLDPSSPPPPDTIAPDTTLISGPSGTVISGSASFSFASEPGARFECRVDGGSWASCASPKTFSGLSNGSHVFDVRATDAAGNTDPTPATRAWTIEAAAPAPGPSLAFVEGYDGPWPGYGALWGNASYFTPGSPWPWNGDSDDSAIYSIPVADRPTNVGATQEHTYSQRWLNRLSFPGPVQKVEADVKPLGYGSSLSGRESWSGFKFYLRRTEPVDAASNYTAEPYIADGTVHIQKKCWGVIDPDNPLAVDTGAGGTWYLLAQRSGLAITNDIWHHLEGTASDNPDGSVTVRLVRDGVELLRATDTPGLTGCAPLHDGYAGWRSDSARFYIDDFRVSAP